MALPLHLSAQLQYLGCSEAPQYTPGLMDYLNQGPTMKDWQRVAANMGAQSNYQNIFLDTKTNTHYKRELKEGMACTPLEYLRYEIDNWHGRILEI